MLLKSLGSSCNAPNFTRPSLSAVQSAPLPPLRKPRRLSCGREGRLITRCKTTSDTPGSTQPPREQQQQQQPVKVPRSIQEIDNGALLGFGADLAEDHPGFHDQTYKQRRSWIADLARNHRVGIEPIPVIEYTKEEIKTWGHVLRELKQLFPKHACKQFNESFPLLGFREDQVPQLEDLSQVLKSQTGWQIRPVAGLLHPRDFLAGLAFKYFHSTQYMRHHSKPSYTPEPDLCHELIGHVPMLANQEYADLVQSIGLASLGVDDKMVWHLTKVYWYTVEFGAIKEGGDIKAFGAGILSSFGELQHMASGKPAIQPFDPFQKQPKMSYKDGYQKQYFVLESFEDAEAKLRALGRSLREPSQTMYQ